MRTIKIAAENIYAIKGGVIVAKTASEIVKKMMEQNSFSSCKTEFDFIRFIIANTWGTSVYLPDRADDACEEFLNHLHEIDVIEDISQNTI